MSERTVLNLVYLRINAKFTSSTVPLCERKLFLSRSYQILVSTIVLGRLRHTYAKNSVKNHQGGATISGKKPMSWRRERLHMRV
jgi:hypothetical protein